MMRCRTWVMGAQPGALNLGLSTRASQPGTLNPGLSTCAGRAGASARAMLAEFLIQCTPFLTEPARIIGHAREGCAGLFWIEEPGSRAAVGDLPRRLVGARVRKSSCHRTTWGRPNLRPSF